MMFALFLLFVANPAQPTLDEVRYNDCLKLAERDAASALVEADSWVRAQPRDNALGLACRANAHATAFNFLQASLTFADAARAAANRLDSREAAFWMQAANAAIADGDSKNALVYIDEALKSGRLKDAELADARIDRARALVLAGREVEAGADLAEARLHAPENAAAWLLSATLSRRVGKLSDAQAYISTASKLAPRMAEVALEAGNIALASGDRKLARSHYETTVSLAPKSRMADTAKARLAELSKPGQ